MKKIIIYCILIQFFISIGCIQEKQWEKISGSMNFETSSRNSTILGVNFLNQRHGWGATYSNLIETYDGGINWKQLERNMNTSYFFSSFDYIDSSQFWATGTSYEKKSGLECGFIMTTSDFGENWQVSIIPHVYMINRALVDSPNIIWAVGVKKTKSDNYNPIVIQTVNGGNTWVEKYNNPNASLNLTGINSIGNNNILVIGNNGVIINSIDAGLNWEQRESGVNSILLRIRIFNNVIWIVGDNGTLLKSEDYGQTWIRIGTDTQKGLLDILMHNEIGWIVGEDGIILRTKNYGKSWEKDISNTSSTLTALSINENSVWAVGENRTVLQVPLD